MDSKSRSIRPSVLRIKWVYMGEESLIEGFSFQTICHTFSSSPIGGQTTVYLPVGLFKSKSDAAKGLKNFLFYEFSNSISQILLSSSSLESFIFKIEKFNTAASNA